MIIKVKSFTIIELMISLLISSIVVSLSYYTFILTTQQLSHYKIKSELLNRFLLLDKTLQNDFNNSVDIKDSAGSYLLLSSDSSDSLLVKYIFKNDFIVRNIDLVNDTFFLKSNLSKIDYVSDSLQIVKTLLLKIELKESIVTPIFIKNYTSAELINAENKLHE